MIEFIDIITDLVQGDSGKREISYQLSKRREYTHCMRVNGGSNSGGNVHYLDKDGNEKHFVLHQVPTGIFNGKKCIIGSGCVVSAGKLYEEIQQIKEAGFDVDGKIFVAKNAHIVLEKHVQMESSESEIGTTRQGIGPCYSDKYARIGVRAEDVLKKCADDNDEEYTKVNHWFESIQIDLYDYLYNPDEKIGLLVEMAQGFYLDIDHGDYPYVTSSHTTVAGALLNLLPWNKVRKVYGVCKAYDTYVGSKTFQPKDEIFEELQTLGKEFGATTGRKRQCNWINLPALKKAINVNCVNRLVISKIDVLDDLNKNHDNKYWKVLSNKITFSFENKNEFMEGILELVDDNNVVIQFRDSPSCELRI